MPTAYTSDLTPESSFRHFALSVARGFGALIHMRDEPMEAPITLPTADDYYTKAIAKAQARVLELETMPVETQRKQALSAYKKAVKRYNQWCEEATEKRTAYRNMLAKVEAWQAPSADHEGLKADMIRQLTESDRFDNSILDNAERAPKPQLYTEWHAAELAEARRQVERNMQYKAEEDARIADRCRWVEQLYASLPA